MQLLHLSDIIFAIQPIACRESIHQMVIQPIACREGLHQMVHERNEYN